MEAACLAHARRKFWDVHEKTKLPIAREALERIAALYRIEDMIRGRPPDHRLRIRREHTAPLMSELHDWLKPTLSRIPGRSELAKAIRYTLSRWDGLSSILADGRACIDNSAAERAMRPITLGRRNWTFAGSDAGGERAAAIYSLIETAKSWLYRTSLARALSRLPQAPGTLVALRGRGRMGAGRAALRGLARGVAELGHHPLPQRQGRSDRSSGKLICS